VANILLDTDVCVDHLRGRPFRPRGDRVHTSAITRAELFAGGHDERVRDFLEPFLEIAVDRRVAERAGRLRRLAGLRLPDALIAATALEHRLVLVTRNERDFRAVRGLRLRVPD
jgi:predicted nucleic acid-binding protein